MKWIKRVILIMVIAGIAVSVVWAYRPKPVTIETARVERGRMSVSIEADGKTRVHDRYVISIPLMGQLARIELHPGDEVREGAVLARLLAAPAPLLDPRAHDEAESRLRSAQDAALQAEAGVERARIAHEFAVSEANRQRSLAEHAATPPATLEQAEADERVHAADFASARFAARVAAHGVETARALLGRLQTAPVGHAVEPVIEITAPASGRVLRVAQQSAGVVNAGTALLEVGDPAALEIVADVLTEDAVHVVPGAHVTLEQWGGDQPLDGRVRLVEPSAFTHISALGVEEQRVNVIIDLVTPPERWRALGDGYRLETHIETWAADNVLHVPAGAVFRHGEGWAVFVVDAGRARRRMIDVGRRNDREVEVTGRLAAGDTVVLHPAETIDDGTHVIALGVAR